MAYPAVHSESTPRAPRSIPEQRSERAASAEQLAAELLSAARSLSRGDERARRESLARLTRDPSGQVFTTALTDRIFRSKDARKTVEQLQHLCERFGLPASLSALERAQLSLACVVGNTLPTLVAAGLRARVRGESRSVLLRADPASLRAFLQRRRREGVRVNVNQLGEALVGEREAEARVQKYVALAQLPDVGALSVKVSSIGSQLNLLAFEETVASLARRLARIYAASLTSTGAERVRIMLDMEAYQDVALTFAVLKSALADPALHGVRAGMVVQAYLPDSNALLQDACAFSAARVAQGGEPLHLRLVKGANLAQERVESERTGLSLPIFAEKREVDANFKRLLERAAAHAARGCVSIGVGSHNLFDLAYALVLREREQARAQLGVEMLEGMAEGTVRAVAALGVDVLVYAPLCSDDAMSSGIAYLVRRLDENTASENFLRASFDMQPGDASFERERRRFREAIALVDDIDERPFRERTPAQRATPTDTYRGEPDSDFARADVRATVQSALVRALPQEDAIICSVVDGEQLSAGVAAAGEDPSRPGHAAYRIALAGAADVERALTCAARDPAAFSASSPEWREALLSEIAALLRARRGELIRALVLDGGKRVVEADAEVSEAIDFAEYYRHTYRSWRQRASSELTPRGCVLVTPPWNFPLAIAAGGVLSALVAGNRVILKPALETPLVGTLLAQAIWDAGTPRQALQLLICEDAVASTLVSDARIDTVILTGATDTAQLFQRLRPGLRLLAETGGKNAYIVSAMSDRELAIRDVVHSAFGHAGQKCSACSLLILEAEVYDDPHFMETLADAARSLSVGAAWEPSSFVTPLIKPASGALLRGLSELAPGETWLVEPRIDPSNPRLVSPGVKLGVKPGSFMHSTELFGPLLAVMRASSLDHAIELANLSGYALTAGLSSLDEREHARFSERIRAGNIYINRSITGAIVQRQPFGGYGKSGFGPGAKAGGPNYVVQLCRARPGAAPKPRPDAIPNPLAQQVELACELLPAAESERLARYLADYAYARGAHFALTHDFAHVLGQDNLFCYRPKERVTLRIEQDASLFDALVSCLAAQLCGAPLDVSVASDFPRASALRALAPALQLESIETLSTRAHGSAHVRVLGTRRAELGLLASETGAHIADEPVLADGCLELLHYLREQSICIDYHRYGNLGARGLAGSEPQPE